MYENCADMNTAGMFRVSFGIYNTEQDVEDFLNLMPQVMDKAIELTKDSPADPLY